MQMMFLKTNKSLWNCQCDFIRGKNRVLTCCGEFVLKPLKLLKLARGVTNIHFLHHCQESFLVLSSSIKINNLPCPISFAHSLQTGRQQRDCVRRIPQSSKDHYLPTWRRQHPVNIAAQVNCPIDRRIRLLHVVVGNITKYLHRRSFYSSCRGQSERTPAWWGPPSRLEKDSPRTLTVKKKSFS